MGVLFNFIPGSGLVAPGTFAEVNSGGQYESASYILVLGHKSAAGSLAADTITLCSTIEEAAALAGPGSQLYEAYREARRKAPVQPIYISAIPVTGTAAAWTVTVGTLPAAGGTGILEIAGRQIPVTMQPGDAASAVAAAIAAAVNAWVDPITLAYLPVTAAAASNVVTLTARHAGTAMNEVEVFSDPGIAGNIFGPAGRLTIASSVSGTGAAAVATTLAALGDYPFDTVISPFGDDTSLNAAAAAFSDVSGRWAWYVQLYGHYWTVRTDNTANLTTLGLARNDAPITILGRFAAPTPSWELLAAYAAIQVPWLADDTNGNAARNQSDRVLEGIRPPRNRATWPNYTVNNTLLAAGISTFRVNRVGQVVVEKAVTTRRLNAQGMPDTVFRAVQTRYLVMHGLRYIRAGLSYRHGNKALAAANPANLPSISTPADIKADMIALYGDLVDRGLFQDKAGFAKRLVVEIDAANKSRVNIGFGAATVNPLDIFALSAVVYNSFPQAA